MINIILLDVFSLILVVISGIWLRKQWTKGDRSIYYKIDIYGLKEEYSRKNDIMNDN